MKKRYFDMIHFHDLYPNLAEKAAVKDFHGEYSYEDLNRLVNAITKELVSLGVKRQDVVGIHMENSMEFIASVLACLRLATIFVPFAKNNPLERSTKIYNNCNPKVVLSKSDIVSTGFTTLPCTLVLVDELIPIDELSDVSFPQYNEKDIAYIIYTSGSTGEPKGVAIKIESLMNYVSDTVDTLCFEDDLVTLNMTSFAFDGALTGIFCFLFCRGKIVIRLNPFLRPQKFFNFLCDEGITDIGCSPIQMEMLAQALECSENQTAFQVRTIAVGGEELPAKYAKKILESVPGIRILNRYGPTETTIVSSCFEVSLEFLNSEFSTVPIGTPLKNVFYKVVREDGSVADVNEVGELYIGGIQVMHSYWNDDVLTDEFIEIDSKGMRWYKTKDLVRLSAENIYEFIGRKDDMVKIYGNRIYLSEVEHALIRLNNINQACCLTSSDSQGNKQIVAIIKSNDICDERQVKSMLKNAIPMYMIPHKIIQIDSFPTNNSGKVDRNKLKNIIDLQE